MTLAYMKLLLIQHTVCRIKGHKWTGYKAPHVCDRCGVSEDEL